MPSSPAGARCPRYLDQAGDNLRRGAAEGRIGVAMLCRKVTEQIDEVLARPDAEWPLAEPAEQVPEIRDELLRIIGREIRPAYERYRSLIADEIAPRARPDDRPGLSHVPGGDEAYRLLARAHTSLDIAPEAVHAIGLEEIQRIDAEFEELGAQLLGTNGLAATLTSPARGPGAPLLDARRDCGDGAGVAGSRQRRHR